MSETIIDGFSGSGDKLKINPDGSLSNNTENNFWLDIPLGNVPGYKYALLSGKNPGIDPGQPVDVWSMADEIPLVNYPVGNVAVTMFISSTDTGDVGQTVVVDEVETFDSQNNKSVLRA